MSSTAIQEHTWDTEPEGGAGGGLFLKFEDGQEIRMRFPYPGVRFTKAFREGDTPKERYGTLVIVHSMLDGKPHSEIKAFEFGISIAKALAALAKDEEWGNPAEYDVKITRKGSGMDTKYTVVPAPKKPLSDSDKELLKNYGKLPIDIFGDAIKAGVSTPANDDYDPFE
jgi:hypothetical protein